MKTNYIKISLKPGKESTLRRFHPWVFSGAIAGMSNATNGASKIENENIKEGKESSKQKKDSFSPKAISSIQEGDKVEVYSSVGDFLGVGHAQIGGISVRILSFEPILINESFYANKIEKAYHLRQTLGLIRNDNTIFRLIYGEGDGLSGLIVDVYGSTAVMQAHSPGMHLDREIIASALIKVCGKDLQNVYYKSKSTLSSQTGLNPTDEYLIKDRKIVETKENLSIPDSKFAPNSKFAPTKNSSPLGDSLVEEDTEIAWENGLKVYPNWIHGQKTGFFIDQRDNRALVEKYAKGKNVLNMFCYTGGFSLYALRGGANKVHSVDSSSNAMALTDANVSLNFGKQDRHQSFTQEAFAFLDKAESDYNLIILDPPAFAKSQRVLNQALQGYRNLNARAIEKIQPGGILFTFSCSQAVSREQFRLTIFSAAAQAKRKLRILHQLSQGADHPINIYHPEGEYLKGLVLYVE
ncbi:MAG: class I SAM-dependent rRNA methyltransferase [Bacteroidales bacterium]